MGKLKSIIAGGARVEITGHSLERLLTKLTEELALYDVVRDKHDKLILSLDYRNLNKLFALIDKTCYNVVVIKSWGILPALANWKKRLALIIASAGCAGALVALSLFVWNVDIAATDGFDTAVLSEYLASEGVRPGVSVFALQPREVEKKVYLAFSDVAFVSCKREGVSVKIKVVKALDDVTAHPNKEGDLLSRHAGVVSRVVVTSGTALVKPGDIVEVGTPLIGGYRESETVRVPCAALGEVYVRQNMEYTENVELRKKVRARTGNRVEVKSMRFFGGNFAMKSPEMTYEEYDLEEYSYYPFQNNLLPIRVDVKRYWEVLVTYEDINFNNVKNIYYEYALANARDRIEGSFEVANTVIEDRREGNVQVIDVLLQIERLAG